MNLVVRNKDGDLELNKLALEFQQGTEGSLKCETLRLPGLGVWHQLRAGISYNQSKLAVTGLTLDPLVEVHQLQIDLSESEQGKYRMTLDAKALGSSVAANAAYLQPGAESVDRLGIKCYEPGTPGGSEAMANPDFRINSENRSPIERRN